jgi:predicted site-specific integrase-resolvase
MPALLDERLTTSAAARIAGVSAETVRAWVRAGRLAVISTPLGMLIDRASLGHLIAEREATQRERQARR